MDELKTTFCKALDRWQKAYFKGTRTELGKLFNVSQGYISNILAGRKCGDETWRRMVALKIGTDYDTMIGIKKTDKKNVITFKNQEDKQHFEVTLNFKNKPLAIEINRLLVKIEHYDPDELKELKDIVAVKLKKYEKKTGGRHRSQGQPGPPKKVGNQ